MSRAEAAADRAARWILAQEEDAWSSDDQRELDAWLSLSDGNRTAYLRLRHGWREANRIAALGAAPRGPASWRQRGLRRFIPLGIAASIALVAGSQAWFRSGDADSGAQQAAASFATPLGGRRTVALADGSTIELNTSSNVRASVGPDKREVWLDRGEAFFQVAHKAGLPFEVHAGDRLITVLGTKFSVRRAADKVTVSVLEGRVRVAETEGARELRSWIIAGGDIAIAKGPATLVSTRDRQKVEDALAWRSGMLSFDQTNLGEIAAEFNRYNARKIVIVDSRTAALRIGGLFPVEDPEAFTRLLRDAYGLRVEETASEVRISE